MILREVMFIFLQLIIDHLQEMVDASKSKRGPRSQEKKIRKRVLFLYFCYYIFLYAVLMLLTCERIWKPVNLTSFEVISSLVN